MNCLPGIYIFCSFYMTGVIWIIQLIHYPAFLEITDSNFIAFHQRHSTVMLILVGPIMVVELLTVLVLAREFEIFWLVQAAMTILLWGLTFFVSVPIHNKLAQGQKKELLEKLTSTNWPRTLIWTAKAGLLLYNLKMVV
jgi:hypothetical protein